MAPTPRDRATPPVPTGTPRAGVPLASLTTLGVGGPAEWFVRARTLDDVRAWHGWCAERRMPLTVLGGGSNVVVADAGVRGLVLQMDLRGVRIEEQDARIGVTAGAGEQWETVVEAAVARGVGAVACLAGIPGLVGGTPIQNVGAYGQDVSSVIERVLVFDRASGAAASLRAAECGFGYRTSRFKTSAGRDAVVCEVTFSFRRERETPTYPDLLAELERRGVREPPDPAAVRDAVIAIRRRKGMVLDVSDPDTRSVGSFFVNPVLADAQVEAVARVAGEPPPRFAAGAGQAAARQWKVPAAWLIERAGFPRGFADGPVGLSAKHTLAIVNRGGASAADVVRLARRIATAVHDRFGVALRPEPVFLGFDDDTAAMLPGGATR